MASYTKTISVLKKNAARMERSIYSHSKSVQLLPKNMNKPFLQRLKEWWNE